MSADAYDLVKAPVDLSRALSGDARVRARSLNLSLSSSLESLLVQAISIPTRTGPTMNPRILAAAGG